MTKKRDDTDEYVGEIKDLLDLRAMGLQGESRTYPTKKAWDLKQKIITKRKEKEEIMKKNSEKRTPEKRVTEEEKQAFRDSIAERLKPTDVNLSYNQSGMSPKERRKFYKNEVRDENWDFQVYSQDGQTGMERHISEGGTRGIKKGGRPVPFAKDGADPDRPQDFPLYYYFLGHQNMQLNMQKSRPDQTHSTDREGFLTNEYKDILRTSTVFKLPSNIADSLHNTKLPKNLDRHVELRMPKRNMFIETAFELYYPKSYLKTQPLKRKYPDGFMAFLRGFHVVEWDWGKSVVDDIISGRMKNTNLLDHMVETTTIDGNKFDGILDMAKYLEKTQQWPERMIMVRTLEEHPENSTNGGGPDTISFIWPMWSSDVDYREFVDPRERDMRNFVFNYLLFVNNPEVEYVDKKPNLKSNKNRVRRGKMEKPIWAAIRLKGRVKQAFANNRSNGSGTPVTGHEVRGHWRNFHAKRFTNMRGKRVWIPEFQRGEGYAVARNYKHIED